MKHSFYSTDQTVFLARKRKRVFGVDLPSNGRSVDKLSAVLGPLWTFLGAAVVASLRFKQVVIVY